MAHQIFSIPQVHGSPLPSSPQISPRRIDASHFFFLYSRLRTVTNSATVFLLSASYTRICQLQTPATYVRILISKRRRVLSRLNHVTGSYRDRENRQSLRFSETVLSGYHRELPSAITLVPSMASDDERRSLASTSDTRTKSLLPSLSKSDCHCRRRRSSRSSRREIQTRRTFYPHHVVLCSPGGHRRRRRRRRRRRCLFSSTVSTRPRRMYTLAAKATRVARSTSPSPPDARPVVGSRACEATCHAGEIPEWNMG